MMLIVFLQIFAVCNIAIDISALIHLHELDRTMEPQEKFIYFPPGLCFSLCPVMMLMIVTMMLVLSSSCQVICCMLSDAQYAEAALLQQSYFH